MPGEEISEPSSESPIMSPSSRPELRKSPLIGWLDTPTHAMCSMSPSHWSFSPQWELPTSPFRLLDIPLSPLWEPPTSPSDHAPSRLEQMCSPNGVSTSPDQRPLFPLWDLSVVNGLNSPGNANPSVVYGAQQAYSSTSRRSYQVFMSFSGEDTRKTFTDHLYSALKYSGIQTLFDEDDIRIGRKIQLQMNKAIKESMMSIVVLSRNYASSSWCLDELAMILEWKRTSRHKVIPVFYGVYPSEVRKQLGYFGDAFARLQERFKEEAGERQNEFKAKVERWREALREVTDIVGVCLHRESHASAISALTDTVRRLSIQDTQVTSPLYKEKVNDSFKNLAMCSPNGVTSPDQRPLSPLLDLPDVNGFNSPGNANPSLVYGAQEAYSSTSQRRYQVFVSFRGDDTRNTFTDLLHMALKNAGIRAFRDHDDINIGENILCQMHKAIQESTISIVVISKNYACSMWCLDELVMILDRKRTSRHNVIPVFYDVDPSEVRHQKGRVREAFEKFGKRFEEEVGEIQNEWQAKVGRWREALREVSDIAGMDLHYQTNYANAIHALTDIVQRLSFQDAQMNSPLYKEKENNLFNNLAEQSATLHERTETTQAVYAPESQNDVVFTGKQGLRKTVKRKPEMPNSSIGLEVLKQYFSMKLTDAAKSLNVSQSTLKRICRKHGISRWPSHKRSSLNHIRSVEGAFGPTPAKGPSLHLDVVGLYQQDSQPSEPSELQEAENILPTCMTSSNDKLAKGGGQMLGASISSHKELHVQTRFLPDPVKASNECKTASTSTKNRRISIDNSCQGNSVSPPCLDLGTHSHEIPHVMRRTDARIVTIKATYGEDTIRFQVSSMSGIVKLKEEVAKRLKLEIDSFNVKYLDDDHDWILIGCEADLSYCMDLSSSVGSDTIKLQIHKIPNSDSPCESTKLVKRKR